MSKTNFSVQEMELLVNLVEKYKHFLNCKITNAVFNKKKEEAWDSLTTDFNAASLCKQSRQQLQNKFKNMKKETQKKRNSDKVEIFKTGGGTPNLLCTSLDERLAAMGALIKPLPCRFDCDYVYETAVSSGTQGGESAVVQVDESIFTPDDHPLDETLPVKQDLQKTRETLCSTPLTTAPQIRKSKRKPNASVKTAEAANARKVAVERDYEQIAQFREEEHRATMTYQKREHFLKMKVLKAKLEHYNLLNKKIKFELEKEN
ncbi:uncharacterized protein TNCT_621191 [Trichonephila clavata]|uniref:Regulatory protein zeste n=1 Tax=Trichonephila clavata TaxID=2740835 RepID=A0A8X6LH28_TRICU|nr:uncharacterized protein TNCT_621191 [Trichonephila clavata]